MLLTGCDGSWLDIYMETTNDFATLTDEALQSTFSTAQEFLLSGYATSKVDMRVAQSAMQRSADELTRRGFSQGWSK